MSELNLKHMRMQAPTTVVSGKKNSSTLSAGFGRSGGHVGKARKSKTPPRLASALFHGPAAVAFLGRQDL